VISQTFITTERGQVARVTFTLSRRFWADRIHLVGDFNNWDRSSHPFRRDHEGRWVLTVDLEVDRAYQFRYLCDGEWMNESQADAYVHNPHGGDNCVVVTDPNFKRS
jgi:1,4-alpha-glucan branching enzyme